MTQALTERYAERIAGVLCCYDRVVITGTLPTVWYADGMTRYLHARGVRIFDYPDFAKALRERVRETAAALAAEAGIEIEHVGKPHVRKEDIVARVLAQRGEAAGLVHVISASACCCAGEGALLAGMRFLSAQRATPISTDGCTAPGRGCRPPGPIDPDQCRLPPPGRITQGQRKRYPMVGITLSAEQIRSAPPEVRHWLEQQIAALLSPLPVQPPHPGPRLVRCSRQDVQAILAGIQDLLPVVSVFFELGREAASVPVQGMRALRVADILRHTRLQSADQVIECLEMITDTLRRVRGDASAMLCAVDREGRCYVAEETAANILALWQDIVAARTLQPASPPIADTPAAPVPPFRITAPEIAPLAEPG